MELDERGPLDQELDVFGMTDVGKVRKRNEDHFLICSLHKLMQVHSTSLPNLDQLPLSGEQMAFLALVADGVGGHAGGDVASRMATESVARYITRSMQCYYTRDPNEDEFVDQLHDTVMQCHVDLLAEAAKRPKQGGMATTLTLFLGIWPRAFIVQVGDSRCYQLRGDKLNQITRDQTLSQDLIDRGVLTPSKAGAYDHVLSSAVGGSTAEPVIYKMTLERDDVVLLCSDGLTTHVTDEQIRDGLIAMESSEQVCRKLVSMALDRGGRDNITVVIGRAKAT
ncbi:MAG: serine/threonine-protein phosphatase [Gemmatimonadota bacterium]|nr:MAG: serine/threonine-protein phosphatase [Gemmatimonadota bacterium]